MENNRGNHTEFIALMAALMSIVALALDALLPALDIIGIADCHQRGGNRKICRNV